jgi:hypothetical protein
MITDPTPWVSVLGGQAQDAGEVVEEFADRQVQAVLVGVAS